MASVIHRKSWEAIGDAAAALRDLPLTSRHRFRLSVSQLPDGSELSFPANVLVGHRRTPVLVAVAGHHGDEHEGPAALAEQWRKLDENELDGTLVMVPVLNPPAFRASRRLGLDDEVDINRVFPGDPLGTPTHRIANAFTTQLVTAADFILSMHGWSSGYLVLPYIEFPKSTSVRESSRLAGDAFGLQYLASLDAGPGRLLTVASEMGVPIIEVEIGGQGVTMADRRTLYENGLRNLMQHLRMLDIRDDGRPAAKLIERHEVPAPTGGLIRREVELGEFVNPGTRLATILDLNTEPLAEVVAPVDGVVGVLRLAAPVLPGQLVATVFEVTDG